jgi:hypothetical protein
MIKPRRMAAIAATAALLLPVPAALPASGAVPSPLTGSFSPTGSLIDERVYHTATRLPDGRVLVIGGDGDDGAYTAVAAAELWGPGSALSACPSVSASATPQTSSPPGT